MGPVPERYNVKYPKLVVLPLAALLALGVYCYLAAQLGQSTLLLVRLADWYALIALAFLYVTLLGTPLWSSLPNLPGKAEFNNLRGALGLSSLLFALLHGTIAFFGLLQGFGGLSFLPYGYRQVVGLGFAALTILLLCAGPSFPFIRDRLQGSFQALKWFLYTTGIIIIVHATLIGSHFVELGRTVPQLVYLFCFLLLFLETIRIRNGLLVKIGNYAYAVWLALLVGLLWAYYFFIFANVHSYHVHG